MTTTLLAHYPTVAIVGRPNVGKSTLFNCLTRSKAAIVHDQPGVTRDRQYGVNKIGERAFIVIDTGGVGESPEEIDTFIARQVEEALKEADVILFIVDARAGLTASDELLAKKLRACSKPLVITVNKIDGLDENVACGEFYALGFAELVPIAASHGRGMTKLVGSIVTHFPPEESISDDQIAEEGIKVAVVGRPNVGKSTLINRLLGEERVVVSNLPGTTRDSIFIPFTRRDQAYTLIDTAGVRRRSRVKESLEKFSIIKTLQAIQAAHVVIFIVDAQEGVVDQDLHLLDFVVDAGKSLLIAVNKWDGLTAYQKDRVRVDLERRLAFVSFAQWHFISALHGTGVGELYPTISAIYKAANQELSTPLLSRLLKTMTEAHQPPLVRGRRIKLRYAHPGGRNPPIIVIHGNQLDRLPKSYERYLENSFRDALHLVGTPIRIELRASENPYSGIRNTLTPHQKYKRQRLMRFVKKRK